MKLLQDIPIRDPYVLYENGIYYLYASGIRDGRPCFLCYRSSDLTEFGNPVPIFEKNPDFWGTRDFWAPEVHKYKERYYLLASFKAENRCRGTSILVSDTPDGTFTPLINRSITPFHWECLDGTLYVENNIPYLIFCKEWLQVKNGEMYIAELSEDLSSLKSDPILLFKAKDALWTRSIRGQDNFVTDGPFIFKQNGEYCMIWSSFSENGYAMGLARSRSLTDGWVHEKQPLYDQDGGHGMIFDNKGEETVIFHSPNGPSGRERMKILPLKELLPAY